VLDVVMKGKEMRAIDLLVHRGEDIHMEPLEDRLQILRTMYHTDDNLSFPMPLDTKFTDHEGLSKQTDSIGGDVWIRDAKSTFAKGKKAHHLWVLFTPEGDGLTKGTTLPFVVNEGDSIGLEYPGHAQPLVVKGQWDGSGLDIESIEPEGPLARHAAKQAIAWGPVAAHLIKTHQREVRPYPHAIPSRDSFVFNRAPLMEPDGKHSEVTGVMSRVKRHLMDRDEAQDKEGLIRDIKGLTEHMLEEFGEEFGVERTEDGRFTVNEAIDDDMVETKMGTTLSAISGSITGGGWNGLMDMHTAPRGPTSLVDDEGIPMFDPYETDDLPPEGPRQLRIRQVSGVGEEVEGDVEIDGPSATLRYPNKTRQEAKEEAEIETEINEDQVPIP
jgi:hypothetical protein